MDCIRPMQEKDYLPVRFYWAANGSNMEPATNYPKHNSFIYERSGKPLYAMACYRIEGLPMAYLELAIRDPSKPTDKQAFKALVSYIENQCQEQGIRLILAFAGNVQLTKHYNSLGYNKEAAERSYVRCFKQLGEDQCQNP